MADAECRSQQPAANTCTGTKLRACGPSPEHESCPIICAAENLAGNLMYDGLLTNPYPPHQDIVNQKKIYYLERAPLDLFSNIPKDILCFNCTVS